MPVLLVCGGLVGAVLYGLWLRSASGCRPWAAAVLAATIPVMVFVAMLQPDTPVLWAVTLSALLVGTYGARRVNLAAGA